MNGSAVNVMPFKNKIVGKLLNPKVHTHSRAAYKILRGLAFARIVDEGEEMIRSDYDEIDQIKVRQES